MRMTNSSMRSTAAAALFILPLATSGSLAQPSQESDQTQQPSSNSQDAAQQRPSESASGSGQTDDEPQADAMVAMVGDAQIRGSDVTAFISMLPPQLRSQPAQMLVPMALEQLILRELILEEARGENLAEDPEVIALVEGATGTAQDEAMVQVWLDREMVGVVTDEAVQEVYEGAEAQGQQELPSIDAVRPQIEQHLRQQAMQNIQAQLQEGADIVVYDPTGQPMEQQQSGQAQEGQGGQSSSIQGNGSTSGSSSGSSSGGQSGGGISGGQSSDGSSGSSGTSGRQTQTE